MATTLSLALGAPAGDPPAALAIPTLIDGLLQRTRANRAKRQALLDAVSGAAPAPEQYEPINLAADPCSWAPSGYCCGNAYWSDECATGREDVVCGGFTLNGEGSYLCDKHPSAVVLAANVTAPSPVPDPGTADALRVRALTDEVHQLRAWKRSNCGDGPVESPDDGGEECPPWVADLRAMARRLDECEKELAELHAKISSRRAEIDHMRSLNESVAPSPQPISWPPLQIPTPSPWATPAPYPRCLGCAGAPPPVARPSRAIPARRA